MDNEIKVKMDAEITKQIEGLSSLTQGSDEHSKATESLQKLYKLRIDQSVNETNSVQEDKIERMKLDEQTKLRYFSVALEAAGIVLPLMFYRSWMKRGFEFEKNGTFTSQTFRGLFGKFKPTKK